MSVSVIVIVQKICVVNVSHCYFVTVSELQIQFKGANLDVMVILTKNTTFQINLHDFVNHKL